MLLMDDDPVHGSGRTSFYQFHEVITLWVSYTRSKFSWFKVQNKPYHCMIRYMVVVLARS